MFEHRWVSLWIALSILLSCGNIFALDDPLPSWNEGTAKNAILQYVKETTQEKDPNYIIPEERIATFDQDGTLWVEQPLYPQFVFILDRIKALAPQHPEWQEEEPFKSILAGEAGSLFQKASMKQMSAIFSAAQTDITTEQYAEIVKAWVKTAIDPKFKKHYTDLVYQPMIEVINLFKKNGFKVYIVSGSGQDFIRTYSEEIYGIPPEQVIGTAEKTSYTYLNGKPVLMKLPQLFFTDDKRGKPEGINLVIGRRPVAAFGNSVGDQQMLEWTQAGKGKRLEMLVHHDDAVREYAYGPESKIGTFSEALMAEAKERGWIVISMKNDWKVIFRK